MRSSAYHDQPSRSTATSSACPSSNRSPGVTAKTARSSGPYNGTAPIEVSSGGRKIHRFSLRGNRRLNHAIHMAAVTQIRHTHSEGRAYFEKKIAEGKTRKEALRALKRQLSDVIYTHLTADAARTRPAHADGPGGQSGNGSVSSAAGSHPRRRLFGQATPGPQPSLRPTATARRAAQATAFKPSRRSP